MPKQDSKQQDSQDKDKAMSAARSAATARLREAHQDEFNSLLVEEAKSRGIDWQPRKTAEQRAAEQLAALLEQYPHLADTLGSQPGEPEYAVPTVETAEPKS